ncbi:MAG: response regulator [Proteobacteria bacterium]|nr:response regulator [Pseudomonadota bacterium]
MSSNTITVLLVDDEDEFTSTLGERLEIRGYTAVTASDGEAGIQCIINRDIDIAVLDLMMPGMNGLETLKQIKNIKPTLPVILLTGHGSTKEGMEGMRLGALDYLMKPLDINELIKRITQAVQHK